MKKQLLTLYNEIKPQIVDRLEEFEAKHASGTDRDTFIELAFCLFTPQSKARSCWEAVEDLLSDGMVWEGTAEQISKRIPKVRFRNNKARYLVEARENFLEGGGPSLWTMLDEHSSPIDKRMWLVNNVKGMGLKEATHFLRNIGQSGELAILDRHILKNLVLYGVIDKIPQNLTPSNYRDIECQMSSFSSEIGIPMTHLDVLLWYKEAGEIFK